MRLFRPHRIIPNTLDPDLGNLDWIAIENMFRDCLSSHGETVAESIRDDIMKNLSDYSSVQLYPWTELATEGKEGDVALKNLEGGDEAVSLAMRWMTAGETGLKRLRWIQEYLPESLKIRLDKDISEAKAKIRALAEERLREESQARSERTEETDEDFCDDRSNTAHRIFAESSFIRSEASSSAHIEEEAAFYTPISSPGGTQNRQQLFTASPTPPSTVFNREYADWFAPATPPNQRLDSLSKTPEPKKITNILSPSINKVNTIGPSASSQLHPAATQNPAPQALLPSNLTLTASSTDTSLASTLSSSSTKLGSKTPPLPNTMARRDKRRAEREERRRIALKLGRARPDLVSEGFTEKLSGHAQEPC